MFLLEFTKFFEISMFWGTIVGIVRVFKFHDYLLLLVDNVQTSFMTYI